MEYKYPPIYKYALYLVLIYMFLKHQHIMPLDKLLINSIVIVLITIAIDYIIIKNHTPIFGNDSEEEITIKKDINKKLDKIIKSQKNNQTQQNQTQQNQTQQNYYQQNQQFENFDIDDFEYDDY